MILYHRLFCCETKAPLCRFINSSLEDDSGPVDATAASAKGFLAKQSQYVTPMADDYAFGEMDEVGKSDIAEFAAQVTPRCLFEFMPVEGRVYFIRKADAGGDRG
jgi:hypothetical protein